MKALILSAVLFVSVAANAASINLPDNEKVVKTFNELFKGASNVTWNNVGKQYEAFFTLASIKTRVTIDQKGRLVQTIRYYGESELPANILYNVKNQYLGKEIFGVTEISNKFGTQYQIVLKDNSHYIHLNANSNGDLELAGKYKRGDSTKK
ncbi:hypothetical protein [Niabella digestorum]|uniref:Beta-lactamase-inhibitor-like PepSY-like domain-containing protein n=1 Tax=Niabella digestorum TaxID=3117701 RepID=A0ABU7RHA0_9BACT